MISEDPLSELNSGIMHLDQEPNCHSLVSDTQGVDTPTPNEEEPSIKGDLLRERLESIPESTLRKILAEQVDLEIRLKHKELTLTEEELGKCEAQMLAIRQFFEVPADISFEKEPNQFTLKYYDLLNRSLSVNYTKIQQQQYQQDLPKFNEEVFIEKEPAHSYRTRSTTSSLRPSLGGPAVRIAGCLYRRTDGVIVKLTCPDCQRSNFSLAQGFLNHSRIAHTKEYTSQDAAALLCGEILPEQFQDEEGLSSLKSLNLKGLEPSKNLNVNEIYFNGLSNTLNTVHRAQPPENAGAQTEPRATLETEAGSEELMKILIKKGISQDENDYFKLVRGVREPVENSHLFNDEEELEQQDTHTTKPITAITSTSPPPMSTSTATADIKQETDITDAANAMSLPNASANKRGRTSAAKEFGQSRANAAGISARVEVGGKYENRLRRRKSRERFTASGELISESVNSEPAKADSDGTTMLAEDRRYKRKRSHRGASL